MRTGLELLREAAELLEGRGFSNKGDDVAAQARLYYRRITALRSEIREYLAIVDGKEAA